MSRILVIEDDDDMAALLHSSLTKEGYEVLRASDGAAGLEIVAEQQPDLILLDVMLPRVDGWETCRRIRKTCTTPIIFLTARGREQDIVRGLDLGAVDYITKPFGLAELQARIRAALRQCENGLPQTYKVPIDDRLAIDQARRCIIVDGESVELSSIEYKLLVFFIENAGRLLTRENLLTRIWGWEYMNETDYLKVYIHRLRKKIERNPGRPAYILTERGLGYRFQIPGSNPPSW